ncbi:MAG: hypothetical protein RLZZ262_1574 [Bacteroidota bacterium]|jgi:uncharacterized protein with HEPN domain
MAVSKIKRIDPLLHVYILEMIGAAERILSYTANHNFEDMMKNEMLCDAIQHQFEILGEASTHIPFNVRKKFPHIPFALMYSLRNHIAHEYFDVDYEIIWHIIQVDLPKNLKDLQAMQKSSIVAQAAGE